jgi:hypothetical protein
VSAYFRKSFKVAPGVHINISRRGTGVSFGGRGAHVSFSPTGRVTKTVSIPGTGIYYRDVSTMNSRAASKRSPTENQQTAASTEELPIQPTAHQVEAVEHHGFYISHGFAAFALLLSGVLLETAHKNQQRNIWELILLIAGFASLVLWLRDLTQAKVEKRSKYE